MTLAVAMVCEEGILLAADTRVAYQDGTIGDIQKLTGFAAVDGMFTIAHSSHDAHAADSIIRMIRERIENQIVGTFADLEHKIEDALRGWYVPVHDDRPTIQLLLGACLQSRESERALYLCEPPNTVARIWDYYKAIGDGWRISDPLWRWYEDRAPWPVHASLCQVSYMMYRAKKLLPGSVGGHTDAAILTDWERAPYWIKRMDMEEAESLGIPFDRHLSNVASLTMGGNVRAQIAAANIIQGITSSELLYAGARFRCQSEGMVFTRQYNT